MIVETTECHIHGVQPVVVAVARLQRRWPGNGEWRDVTLRTCSQCEQEIQQEISAAEKLLREKGLV